VKILASVLALFVLLSGCTHHPIPKPAPAIEATRVSDPPLPTQIVEYPQALPLPGQLKLNIDPPVHQAEPKDPKIRVSQANGAARVEPLRSTFVNAIEVWPYSLGALYQLYASPEKVTDIALEVGEQLISASAGDTVRWVIGDTTSGSGAEERVHLLVKPTRADLATNLVINTDRRTYHLELKATPATWMASVSWDYPGDRLMAIKNANQRAQESAPIAPSIALDHLNFRYEIKGDTPSWRPIRAFDDGQKTYIEFPQGIAQDELPPLFISGAEGDAQLVNYRVRLPYYIVDRLFGASELKLGAKKPQTVRIVRTDSRSARDR
jgi:P-type conjugative transfer protein TrbG